MRSDQVLMRYTELPFAIDYLRTRELALPTPAKWDDRNDSYYIAQYAERQGLTATYALCLSATAETYHHWRVFSSGYAGVCIVFHKDKLLTAARRVPGMRAEPVKYRTIENLSQTPPTLEDLPFLKRYPYRHELEFRLFLATEAAPKPVFRVVVPISAIEHIALSPWLHESVASHVIAVIKALPGCKNLKVHRSTLIENERWKECGMKALAAATTQTFAPVSPRLRRRVARAARKPA